ncbi:MAG: hypothetical protein U5Q03_06100 [Bacteroidota bacterium]|nr:hypothetical protein [Bacteroidota bacterium]
MRRILFVTLILCVLVSCSRHEKIAFTGEAQGTYYAITYFDKEGRNFQPEIDSLLREFDQVASMWVENSMLSRVNREDSTVKAERNLYQDF